MDWMDRFAHGAGIGLTLGTTLGGLPALPLALGGGLLAVGVGALDDRRQARVLAALNANMAGVVTEEVIPPSVSGGA